MRAIAAADILRLLRLAIETTLCPWTFAQRARWAAAIRARPAADMVLSFLLEPFNAVIAFVSLSS
jgi:hypothetical protein